LSYPAPATADSCARQTGYVAPRIEDQASTLAVLDDLMEAMSLARGVNTLPFELTCEAEDGDDSCSNARAALANLPLSELMSVDFEPTEYQTVSVTPTGEGQSVRVRQAMPGAATIPIAAFGRSGPDGKSWRVTLNGASGELREIGLRRTTVIYH
jgi:hypothetical protein